MGLFKRNDRWYVRWRKDGRLVRRSLGREIKTEAQAKTVWRKLQKQRLEGKLGLLDPSRKTLGDFRKEYVRMRLGMVAPGGRREGGLSAATVRRDDQVLRSLAETIGDRCLLRVIRQKQIEQWTTVLLARGVKPATIASYLRHLRAALSTAAEWGYLKDTPRLKGPRPPSATDRALLPAEMERLLSMESDPQRRALWEFFVWTATRREEVVTLCWQDVHLDQDEPWMRVVGKGGKERLVPLLPGAVRALETMPRLDLGPVWRFAHSRRRELKPVKGWAYTSWFKEAARKAGLPTARLHDLRHTALTWLAARGVSERIIQEIAGHASITTTQIYTKGIARIANLYREMSRGLD